MLHGTRKPGTITHLAALALGLAVACALAGGGAAWADDEGDGSGGGIIGGSVGGGVGGSGGIIGGEGSHEDGAAPDPQPDPSSPVDPEKPYGEIVQVMRGTAIADIYLPELTCDLFLARDDGEQPPLRSLLVERADAAHPDAWTLGAEIPWNEDWQSYDDGDETDPSYLVNAWDEFGIVHYSEPSTDFRDFYVRITATFLIGGALETVVYDPVLLVFPDYAKPAPEPEPEPEPEPKPEPEDPSDPDAPPNSPDADPPRDQNGSSDAKPPTDAGKDFGGIDGNRGGVGQGESERVAPPEEPAASREGDTSSHPTPLPFASAGGQAGGVVAGEGPSADAAAQPDEASKDADDETEDGKAATAAGDDGLRENPAPTGQAADGAEASSSSPVPGYVCAIGATFAALAAGGATVAAARYVRKRARG